MDEKDLQELKLEEIMREFHQEPGEELPDLEEILEEELPELAEQEPEISEIPEEMAEEPEDVSEETPEYAPEYEQEEVSEEIPQYEPEEVLPQWEPETQTESVTEDTIPLETTKQLKGDTIRLEGIPKDLPREKSGPVDMDDTQVLELPVKEEPYSENWEPEYEQPMGEYVPPQPIVFQPRSRLRELKKDLIAGPEKRYYEISEKGFGKLQMAIFLSLLVSVVAITATVIYAMGRVTEERMRLMVFGQFFTMLLSGALGVNLMLDGLADLFHRKFTLNTMLGLTFLACCVDGVLCLRNLQVPCCAAFCVQVTMALISEDERRRIELSQMDTMRKANHLDGVTVCPEFMGDQPAYLRKEAQVGDFMDHYEEPSAQEKTLNIYALAAFFCSIAVAVLAGVFHGVSVAFRVLAVTMLAAIPATSFITLSRPFAVLERRLHSVGTVLCGWQNMKKLDINAIFPLTHEDLYPAGSVRLNGVKFYGSRKPDQIVAYCTAVIAADGGGLTPVFNQVLDSRNGYHYDALNLMVYDGGIGAEVEGEPVLVGSQTFLKKMGVEIPEGIRVSNAVCISIDGEFSGLFAVTFEKVRSSQVGVATLAGCKSILSVLVSSDFILNPAFLQQRFGIKPKRMLIPDQSVRQQLREKKPEEEAPCLMLTTRGGLAPVVFGIVGAKSLQTAGKLGVTIHMAGGILGLIMMAALVVLGALDLLTPVNMFLYQLVWIIPGFLITEWTRSL